MTALALGVGQSSEDVTVRGWIQSPGYDFAFIVLSPIVGTLAVLWTLSLPGGGVVVIAVTFLLAIPHYMSSFSFFLGDENRRYYNDHALLFYGGPAAIAIAVLLLRGTGAHTPVMVTMFVWNIYHVGRQSHGILSIYRRLNNGATDERAVAMVAILSVNATMALWFADRFTPLYGVLKSVHPLVPWLVPAAIMPIALSSLGVLIYRLSKRARRIQLPEGAFLLTSLLLFHPYLWVRDAGLATMGMLIGHFFQYLAIVWLLNHRKYQRSEGSASQRLLAIASSSPGTVIITICVIGLVIFGAERMTAFVGAGMAYIIAFNALSLTHFYLDGLIWAFRNPFVRQSIGPYLMPASHVRVG